MDDHYMKLKRILERTIELIRIILMKSIEAPFFGKKVHRCLSWVAQGVAMAGILKRYSDYRYEPKKIKCNN
jgi:crossover junction endodeoxyribonuclease RuvC